MRTMYNILFMDRHEKHKDSGGRLVFVSCKVSLIFLQLLQKSRNCFGQLEATATVFVLGYVPQNKHER